mgnify:CR=1 FL=1
MKDVFTTNAPAAIGPYTQAKVVGNMVYTSGQIAIVPATGNLAEGGIEAQAKQVCENLKAVLAEAGSDLAKVVKTTCFLKDVARDFGAFNEVAAFNAVYGEYFTNKPARSCVGGLSLPKGALVEVEVIAEV